MFCVVFSQYAKPLCPSRLQELRRVNTEESSSEGGDVGYATKHKIEGRAFPQRYLDIAEIRDDMVLMKDGTCAVLLVSTNFLKSVDEQEAIIQAYHIFEWFRISIQI